MDILIDNLAATLITLTLIALLIAICLLIERKVREYKQPDPPEPESDWQTVQAGRDTEYTDTWDTHAHRRDANFDAIGDSDLLPDPEQDESVYKARLAYSYSLSTPTYSQPESWAWILPLCCELPYTPIEQHTTPLTLAMLPECAPQPTAPLQAQVHDIGARVIYAHTYTNGKPTGERRQARVIRYTPESPEYVIETLDNGARYGAMHEELWPVRTLHVKPRVKRKPTCDVPAQPAQPSIPELELCEPVNLYQACELCEYIYETSKHSECPNCQNDTARARDYLTRIGAWDLPELPTSTPEPTPIEVEYAPAQLDMTREVQLAAIMPEAQPEQPEPIAPDTETEGIPAHLIHANKNDRTQFDIVELRELAEDIEANGLHQAMTVRPCDNGTYEIVMGERRYRAMTQILGWQAIPSNYVTVRDMTDREASLAMFSENMKRVDLNPIDEANAYEKRMSEFGLSVPELAKEVGFDTARIKSRLALLSLIPDAQLMVRTKQLPTSYAAYIVDLDANRQALALQLYNSGKCKNLDDYKAKCGLLLAEQAQDSMFDMDKFMQACEDSAFAESVARAVQNYPTNPKMPIKKRARGESLGEYIENYIAELIQSGDMELEQAASTVGSIYHNLLTTGYCKRPQSSQLSVTSTPATMGVVAA